MGMSSLKPDDQERCRAVALVKRYMRGGPRSSWEVGAYLARHKVSPRVAHRVIQDCVTRGVLDDEACACLWAEHWSRAGYASPSIRARLAAKGFDDETLDHAIAQLQSSFDDEARAKAVAARSDRPGAGRRERARVARRLASRGFDADLIERVLNGSFGPLVLS